MPWATFWVGFACIMVGGIGSLIGSARPPRVALSLIYFGAALWIDAAVVAAGVSCR